jgi:hypothetical protein
VDKYRFDINLDYFNKNLIDPIKLTFDSIVYAKTIKEIVDNEVLRQIDKSNTNLIGYFHQNIFRYIDTAWHIPHTGFDLINEKEHLFIEMKNKYNTMNSSSAQKTYIKMQNKILEDDQATCYLVEVIAKTSQNVPWKMSLDQKSMAHNRIRRISVDQFYAKVTGESTDFKQLCAVLPCVIKDVATVQKMEKNTVYEELQTLATDELESLYLLAFKPYLGF